MSSRFPLHTVPGPFRLATIAHALDQRLLDELEARFAGPLDWARHDQHFYRCTIADVDDWPTEHGQRLRNSVAAELDLDLAGPVGVTLQRMDPGDGADLHTDEPRAGYEAARLVVQLDTTQGGHFRTRNGAALWLDRPPVRNQGVALELGAASHHEVTTCLGVRRTAVFHFWHRANPRHARQVLDATVGTMSFATLPATLDAAIDHADATGDPSQTDRAARVAWWLNRWGYAPGDLIAPFERATRAEPAAHDDEALARFLTLLHLDRFDRPAWSALPPRATRRWLAELDAG